MQGQGLQGGTRWAGHSLHLILRVEQAHHLQQTEEESEEEKPSQADKVPRPGVRSPAKLTHFYKVGVAK